MHALTESVTAAIDEANASGTWRAELALSLARTIDGADSEESISARVSAGKLLAATMAELTATTNEKPASGLDQLAAQRQRRQAS